MNRYNVWNKWGKLKTVMLGSCYSSEFFRDIKNNKIRSSLQRIADETNEDLLYYKSVLEQFGCNVLSPDLNKNDSIMNYINSDGAVNGLLNRYVGSQGVPRSPLQPRDAQVVLGNKIYYTTKDHASIEKKLNEYNKNDSVHWDQFKSLDDHENNRHWSQQSFEKLAGFDWGNYNSYINDPDYFKKLNKTVLDEVLKQHCLGHFSIPLAPCMTLVGRDLYVDQREGDILDYQVSTIKKSIPNIRISKLNHGGHSDACFHTLKPGVILSLNEIQTYEKTFSQWDVCYLPDQSWDKIPGFLKLKNQVSGKWWIPGEEDNQDLTYFVETWLQDWVGYVEETVFDVNVLVLDEHHVCINNMNSTVIEFLKKHRMEPVHIPWRHRYFWDGGLHCITLDLEREGSQEDYFPERGDIGVVDYGFD